MGKKLRGIAVIAAISVIPTLLIWLPFFLRLESFWGIPLPRDGMATIVANYDGPLFLVVAKTFYNPELIAQHFSFDLPGIYYSAHYPLFPILIRLIAPLTGYPWGMLLVTILSSVLALHFFQRLISEFVEKKDVVWMSLVFALLPARWLIVRSVGSAEPLFLATVIASIYYFRQKKYLAAGVWGVLAQLTKSPGILLFVAYGCVAVIPKVKNMATDHFGKWFSKLKLGRYWPLALIPVSLLGLFVFYGSRYGDFFAYFNSVDNIHLFFPPFQIFDYSQPWVGTFWLEEIIFVYMIGVLGLMRLIEKKEVMMAWFVGIFFTSILFVSHRDVIRYALPIVPFLMVGFSDLLVKREFKIVMAVLVIPTFLFALTYISQNVMPIPDWAPFL